MTTHVNVPSWVFRPDSSRLEQDVLRLALPRHPVEAPQALRAAEDLVAQELGAAGARVERQPFRWRGREFHNVIGTLDGGDPARPWVVLGAHFDSVAGSPGADDNASGVAVMLEVARMLGAGRPAATVQLVGFNLEEMQAVLRYAVGSRAYVRLLRERAVRLAGAFVLESVGFTSPRQNAPLGARLLTHVPRVGDFLAALSDWKSRPLLDVMLRAGGDELPVTKLVVPLRGWLVPDVRRSDHARFWDAGYRALMLTDTANFRNPHYHLPSDAAGTLDYAFMGRVAGAVARAVLELAT